jgi:hypothetical protein
MGRRREGGSSRSYSFPIRWRPSVAEEPTAERGLYADLRDLRLARVIAPDPNVWLLESSVDRFGPIPMKKCGTAWNRNGAKTPMAVAFWLPPLLSTEAVT